jgi:hypothetical protein
MLPDGHLMLFDNGSRADPTGPIGSQSADMCPDPADPGMRVARPQTRVTEYALDTSDPARPTATLVWQFVPTDRYVAFAGSQQRLTDGTTFVGWSQAVAADGTPPPEGEPVASLVSVDGASEPWRLFANGWFSYRAAIGPSPDAIDPEVALTSPDPSAAYTEGEQVTADFGCTDTGGSNLDACTGTVADGDPLPMTPGAHTMTVTATDGAGNRTVRAVTYRVAALSRPDAQVRSTAGRWIGDDVYGTTARQRVVDRISHGSVRTRVRLQNDGVALDRLRVTGSRGNPRFAVTYRHAGRDVTRRMLRGTLRTGPLAPGASYSLVVVVHRTSRAHRGDERVITLRARSTATTSRHDAVAVVVRAVR